MWYDGKTLTGAEAGLISEVVGWMYDQIDDLYADDYGIGIGPFDDLSRPQKLAVLAEVASALLKSDHPVARLTAIRAATAAAIYAALKTGIDIEIDTEQLGSSDRSLREKVAAIYESHTGEKALDPASQDSDEWESLVEAIRSDVLPDADWEMEYLFADKSPEESAELKRYLNIDPDYYTDVPPDPTAAELEGTRQTLNELTGARHPLMIAGDDVTVGREEVDPSVYQRVGHAMLFNAGILHMGAPAKVERNEAVSQLQDRLEELREEERPEVWDRLIELALQRLGTIICDGESSLYFQPGDLPERTEDMEEDREYTPPQWVFR